MNLVETTVKDPQDIPEDLSVDEKPTWLEGDKVYIATTVGQGCILGVEIVRNATGDALEKAYGVFQQEARSLNPDYAPETVNTDGWQATQNAWKRLFPFACLLLCFLHLYIKIRDRSKKKYKHTGKQTCDKLWDCYQAKDKRTFSQRIRRLHQWAKDNLVPDFMLNTIENCVQTKLFLLVLTIIHKLIAQAICWIG